MAKSSRRLLVIRRVIGESMLPLLKPGGLVIGVSFLPAKKGSVVIVNHNGLEKIKRIQNLADGQIYITGDNPSNSLDSRSFGWISEDSIRSTVIWPRH